MQHYYIGVDVGSASVRAALVSSDGTILHSATQGITIWEPETDFYEQSSDEIWNACCKVIRVGWMFFSFIYVPCNWSHQTFLGINELFAVLLFVSLTKIIFLCTAD
jgi:2-keto-3-deoxy-galactonokinase